MKVYSTRAYSTTPSTAYIAQQADALVRASQQNAANSYSYYTMNRPGMSGLGEMSTGATVAMSVVGLVFMLGLYTAAGYGVYKFATRKKG